MNNIKLFFYRLVFAVLSGAAFLLMLPVTIAVFSFLCLSAVIGAAVLRYRLRKSNIQTPADLAAAIRTYESTSNNSPIEGSWTRV